MLCLCYRYKDVFTAASASIVELIAPSYIKAFLESLEMTSTTNNLSGDLIGVTKFLCFIHVDALIFELPTTGTHPVTVTRLHGKVTFSLTCHFPLSSMSYRH